MVVDNSFICMQMDDICKVKNFINGSFHVPPKTFESVNPSNGRVVALIPDSDHTDVDNAVKSAVIALEGWSQMSIMQRSDLLLKVADVLESRLEIFANFESQEQGKPVWLAKQLDIPRAVYNFRHFATTALADIDSSCVRHDSNLINYTIHEPMGVAAVITPWNLPLYLLTFKLAPALIYGNTVVAKPSELTSITAYKLCEIFAEVGFPPGVVNVVFGTGLTAGQALVSHPDIGCVSFTGGTSTGLKIAECAAGKKISLELGGKNPAIIFKDFNWKLMKDIVRSCFLNQGEICLCTSRIYVEAEIKEKFLIEFRREMDNLKVGDPSDPETFIGPLVSRQHLAKVQSYSDLAMTEGATVYSSQIKLDILNRGFFFPPTVITDIDHRSRCVMEEIFGPIVCVFPFTTEEEAIGLANESRYGLCGTIWSENVNVIHRVSRKLRTGTVWCNCWLQRNLHMPFGGMKCSGIGREGTFDSREFFTEKKTVCLKIY